MHRLLIPIILLLLLPACTSLISSASRDMADNLSLAMLNQDDPELVKSAVPAYLLMLDSLNANDANNVDLKLSAARLYGAYASLLPSEPSRARKLSTRSLDYAREALCLSIPDLCTIETTRLEQIQPVINEVSQKQQATLYQFSVSWAGWIQSHSDDWNAIAQIPRLEALLKHSIELDETYEQGGAYLYLGVLGAQIPPSLGGKPEQAREYFEKSIKLSAQKNLMSKVLMAEHYARLVFDQSLHDQLLKEVIDSNADHPELTLINTIAQQRARVLLEQSPSFF